jgi:protocatechuate 3,4-dioxygenase beta subunit
MTQFTRRRALAMAGALVAGSRLSLGRTAPAAAASASCVLTPAKTEGPYFVDEKLERSDIRVDPEDGSVQTGLPLTLELIVLDDDNGCAPVAGAQVDIWHANHSGLYSDEAANGTTGHKYLRGYQITDSDGAVEFTTIYPGWYSGRAVHIHFKIRTSGYEFTSQLFFDPQVTRKVMAEGVYASRGEPDTTNSTDNVYGSNGSELIVPLTGNGSGGYKGMFTVGLSGLPSARLATLSRARFRRPRLLRLTLLAHERVTVAARLTRHRHSLARARTKSLAAGEHHLDLRLASDVVAGDARLVVVVKDAAGTSRTIHRTVHVPRRSSG